METEKMKEDPNATDSERVGVDDRRLVRPFTVHDHLGGEVGYVETDDDPIVAYAVKVGVPSKVFRDLGYTTKEFRANSQDMPSNEV